MKDLNMMTSTPIKHTLTEVSKSQPSFQQLTIPGLEIPESLNQSPSKNCREIIKFAQDSEVTQSQAVSSTDIQFVQLIIPGLESFF